MSKLEPHVYQILEEAGGSLQKDTLAKKLSEKVQVDIEKCMRRVDKLLSDRKLVSDHGIISILRNFPLPENPDDVIEAGPIKIVRDGRMLFIESAWEEGEHEKYMRKVAESLPEKEDEIKRKLADIELKIIENFDPLDALAYVTYKNLFGNPEDYTESSFEGKQILVETLANIVLKNSLDKYKKSKREKIPEINDELNDFFPLFMMFVGYKIMTTEATDTEKEVLISTIPRNLIIRGDAYSAHYRLIAEDFFSNFDKELSSLGFTIADYHKTRDEISRQIRYNYNGVHRELFAEFEDFLKRTGSLSPAEKAKAIAEYREKTAKDERLKKIGEKVSEICLKGSFEIEVNEKINKRLLDLLTLSFGDVTGWDSPLDTDRTYLKPVVKANGKYYCFLIPHLSRNVFPIIETLLLGSGYDETKYYRRKSTYHENKAIDIFSKILDSPDAYKSLFYKIIEDGEEKKPEIDGVIIKENSLFLIEVKGKNRRVLSGREDVITALEGDVKKSITEAFEQTKRAHKYVSDSPTAEFFDKSGNKVLDIKRENFENIFLINVTAASFMEFSTNLNLLKVFREKRLSGNVYPYVISLYDLLVLEEMIETPQDLIDYIKERIELNQTHELKAGDELDFLGYFLKYGNLERAEDMKQGGKHPRIYGYSEDIDRWFSYLEGEIKYAEKPRRKKKSREG